MISRDEKRLKSLLKEAETLKKKISIRHKTVGQKISRGLKSSDKTIGRPRRNPINNEKFLTAVYMCEKYHMSIRYSAKSEHIPYHILYYRIKKDQQKQLV